MADCDLPCCAFNKASQWVTARETNLKTTLPRVTLGRGEGNSLAHQLHLPRPRSPLWLTFGARLKEAGGSAIVVAVRWRAGRFLKQLGVPESLRSAAAETGGGVWGYLYETLWFDCFLFVCL